MPDVLPVFVQVTVFALMMFVGMDCTYEDLRCQLRRLRLVSIATLAQFTLVPLVAIATCWLLDVRGVLAASLVLLCCCPAATISNTYTFLSRGTTALSVSLTTMSCLLATVATPAALWAFGGLLGSRGDALHVPTGPLLEQLALLMALPILLGLLVRRAFPAAVRRSLGGLRVTSFVLVLGLIALTALSVPGPRLLGELRSLWIPALVLTALLLPIGFAVARLFRLESTDRVAVIFEFPCQNLAVVALVGVGVLGQPQLVLFAVVFFGVQAPFLLVLTGILARGATRPAASA